MTRGMPRDAVAINSTASGVAGKGDWESKRLNSNHTDIYTLSLHDALPISINYKQRVVTDCIDDARYAPRCCRDQLDGFGRGGHRGLGEQTSELQSHRYLHSFPTRRSSDLHKL